MSLISIYFFNLNKVLVLSKHYVILKCKHSYRLHEKKGGGGGVNTKTATFDKSIVHEKAQFNNFPA